MQASHLFLVVFSIAFISVCQCQRSENRQDSRQESRQESRCKTNELFSHDSYCDSYYECIDGEYIERLCPNGLAFSGRGRGLLANCDYAHRVGCPDEETGLVMGQSPKGSDHCPWLFGIFPHEKSCTRYWHCWNGTATMQMCPFSLLYNEVEHACDWPDKVPGCQQHPLCNGNPNGVRPIANSCDRYWLCVGGYPRMQRCAAGLAFDPEALKCEWAQLVPGCEPPPPPPEEDEEEEPRKPPVRRPSNFRSDNTEEAN